MINMPKQKIVGSECPCGVSFQHIHKDGEGYPISVYNGEEKTFYGEYSSYKEIAVVDLDKLAEFLAKHIEIKAENLIG